MKDYEKLLIKIVNEFADDYSVEEVLDILFPGQSFGEIMNDAFNAGLIPNDIMENFINE